MLGISNAAFIYNHGFIVGTLPTVVVSGLTYANWSSSLPEAQRGYTTQPANDGITNLMKYLVGMSPMETNLSRMPTSATRQGSTIGITGDINPYLTLDVRVRRNLSNNITWKVVCANDLTTIGSSTTLGIQVGTPTPDGDFDIYRFRFPTSVTATPKGFMRLVVTGT